MLQDSPITLLIAFSLSEVIIAPPPALAAEGLPSTSTDRTEHMFVPQRAESYWRHIVAQFVHIVAPHVAGEAVEAKKQLWD